MTILCYHSVDPAWTSPLAIDPATFEEHCAWLARRRTVVDLSAMTDALGRGASPSRRGVALTFDDGFSGVYEHAFPLLQRYGLPATVFLVAETLTPEGRPVDWVDTPPTWELTTLTIDQIAEMADAGIRFESHSYSHHDLTQLDDDVCEEDLRTSRALLEEVLGHPVRYLAYPRGRHDATVRRSAQRAGYTHAFALPEVAEPGGDFALERVGVYPGNGPVALRVKTSPGYLPVRYSRVFPAARGLWRRIRSMTAR